MYQRPSAPRTIGGVLDDSFRLYRESARDWWLPSLLLAVISAAAAVYLTLRLGVGATPAMVFSVYKAPPMLLMLLVRIVVATWLFMTMFAVIMATATNETLSRGEAFRKALRLVPSALGTGILYGLACVVGLILLIVPGLYVMTRLQLWPAALTLGRTNPFDALGSSWQMVKGHWWRTVTILAVLTFMLIAMLFLVGFIAGLLFVVLRPTSLSAIVATQAVASLINIVLTPVFPAAIVATYLDLRLRAEGADLEARVRDLKPD
jgi:hypothetical protein